MRQGVARAMRRVAKVRGDAARGEGEGDATRGEGKGRRGT